MNAETIIREVKDNRIVAILRGMPEDKLIATAEALYAVCVWRFVLWDSPPKSPTVACR